jgi:glutathione peroxidase
MTFRQKILKLVYPVFMRISGRRNIFVNKERKAPVVPFHSLSVLLNNGRVLTFEELKGRKVLLVNTASDCGYTRQYTELQQLQEIYKEKLAIIGFPANDFKQQEKGSDAEIAQFCQANYHIDFPLAKKSSVVKGAQQNDVYQWLTHSTQNGWNDQEPSWNFSKYLVNEEGTLTHYYDPSVSPLSEEVIRAIHQ